MLNPSRPAVLTITVLALVGIALGLSTDIGLFGWAGGVLLALYLAAVGVARVTRGI